MLEKNLKKCLKSRIYIDFKKGKRKRRSWYKKNNYQLLLRKPWRRRSHIRKEMPIYTVQILHFIPLCEHFSNDSLPTTPASQPLDSWTAECDGPQPILTGGRDEGDSPSPGSSPSSLLPRLTSHVRQRSTESNIGFPFSSVGKTASPGWNRSSHFRDVTT